MEEIHFTCQKLEMFPSVFRVLIVPTGAGSLHHSVGMGWDLPPA